MTLQKLRTLAQDSKPSPGVVEEGGLRTQGHLQLQRELEASAGYMRPQGVGCFSVVCFVLCFSFYLFCCFLLFRESGLCPMHRQHSDSKIVPSRGPQAHCKIVGRSFQTPMS